ncbi:MAG TPA: ROK family transcriptional regulator [Candidatus Nitrosopolaris sp.]|nr:ROK family transcriptional regulator [Candidatus Nitrosopolaris sp.]
MARRESSSRGDGSLAWLRERNRERVVGVLRTHGRTSQAEIARATGLSRTTVSTLVAELKEGGVVFEVDAKAHDGRGGRPGVQLVLEDSSKAVIGIDFGHSHVQVALGGLSREVLAERTCELDVDRQAQTALDAAARMVREVLAQAGVKREAVVCAGIGIPGPVDRAHGTVGSATILPGWRGLRIAAEMESRLGLPVEIENDANCGALAEMTWGAGRDCSNFAYIKAATGIGAGLVVDGRLLHGASGTAGEIGHTTLDESGALCYCGNRGCLETVASGPAILQLVGNGTGNGSVEALTLSRVIDLAVEGDVRCRRAISDAGREIGVAVAGLCNLINPERVIVGGLLSRAGDLLLQPVRDSIRRHAVQAAAERVEVVPAVFIERAELMGSLALALRAWNPALASPRTGEVAAARRAQAGGSESLT